MEKKTWLEKYVKEQSKPNCEMTESEAIYYGCGIENGANKFAAKLLEELGEELDKDNYLQVKTVIESLGVEL